MRLKIDPLPALKACPDPAFNYYLRRDLLHETINSIEQLWKFPAKILNKQQSNGAWRYPGKRTTPACNYDLLETFRILRVLVVQYGLNRAHPQIERAAAYVYSCQADEGDIRGILGTQYMPYYHGAILELLIKAGYQDDVRVIKGLDWLLSMRQEDGGWLIPMQMLSRKTDDCWTGIPIPPDRSKPCSHLATGMVLRAFACHPQYQKRREVRLAAECLEERIFKADKYTDRKSPEYWTKFQYPFWWTDLLSTLDSLEQIGFQADEVHHALVWFIDHQEPDGLWETGYGSGSNAAQMRLWVGLTACTVLNRYKVAV